MKMILATDEIRFGINDKLAALTTILLNVDILIIATNTDRFTLKPINGAVPETIFSGNRFVWKRD
jgi:glutamate 5-kinase